MLPIKDNPSSGVFPVVTITLITLTVWVFIVQLLGATDLIQDYGLVPSNIHFSQPSSLITFITSLFLHAGFLHIIFNMLFLYIYGDNVEAALGKFRFLLFYLGGGVIAGLSQYLITPGSINPIVGASGAIAAVLGFYAVKFPSNTVTFIIPSFRYPTLKLPAMYVLYFWFLEQVLNGTIGTLLHTQRSSGIAWWAHIGGFVFGIAVAKLLPSKNTTAR